MNGKHKIESAVLIATVLGSLVLLNLLDVRFFRTDLTRSGMYTLNQATEEILHKLQDPVTVRAYITADLPPPWSTAARYVKDLLEEYYARGDGKFRYEIIDPASEETEEDKEKKQLKRDMFGRLIREKTSIELKLERLGIPSFQAGHIDADTREITRAYMGLLVEHGDQQEVIPRVDLDTSKLEYELTSRIVKISRERLPKVAFVTGFGNPDPEKELKTIRQGMQELFQLTTVDLSQKEEIPDDVDVALVLGPSTELSDKARRAIDKFVMSGRPTAFLLGPVSPELRTMTANPNQHGLGDLLSSYGVELEDALVLDVESAPINIAQQRGNVSIRRQVPYPFMLRPRSLHPDHAVTHRLAGAVFPFMGPLSTTDPLPDGVQATLLVESSPESWLQQPPYNLDPFKRWTRDEVGEQQAHGLVVALTGRVPSHFAGTEEDGSTEDSEQDQEALRRSVGSRLLVANGHAFMLDQFMSRANLAMALNMMDWLAMDQDLTALRASTLDIGTLEELSDGTRALVKYLNIAGLPLAFVVIGVVRWRLRENRRKKVTV